MIFFTLKCKGINSCLMQLYILFKLTDVKMFQTKDIVYAFTGI